MTILMECHGSFLVPRNLKPGTKSRANALQSLKGVIHLKCISRSSYTFQCDWNLLIDVTVADGYCGEQFGVDLYFL